MAFEEGESRNIDLTSWTYISFNRVEDLECSLELGAEEPKSKLLAQFEIFQERFNRY